MVSTPQPRAAYAENPARSLGRRVEEAESSTRTAFARDRDRIIHATAFRRLKEKTQVFVAHEGDHFRTRLTHYDAAGEVFDKVAAALGLGYPGGPVVDELAELGDARAFPFTPPRIKDPAGALDFSFSGLKTTVIRTAQGLTTTPLADPSAASPRTRSCAPPCRMRLPPRLRCAPTTPP